MTKEALYLNGLYKDKLDLMIAAARRKKEGAIFYIQPHSTRAIANLRDDPPSLRSPMTLYASTSKDLSTVSYRAEIVDWRDKTRLSDEERDRISGEIEKDGYNNPGIFDFDPTEGKGRMVNLIYIRNLVKLDPPFSVSRLVKTSDERALSTNRTMAGGWSYVFELQAPGLT